MYRILCFLVTIIVPITFGWWLFIPAALMFVYLAKLPYEIVFVGLALDLIYYFGDGFVAGYPLTLFSLLLLSLAIFLNNKVQWQRIV